MLLVVFLVSVSFFYSPSCHAGDSCPSEKDLSPCICSQKLVGKEPAAETALEKKLVPRRRRDSADTLTPELPETTTATTINNNSNLYTVVKCQEPKTQGILEDRIANGLNRKWLDKLILVSIPPEKRNSLARLPGDCLKNVRIRKLEVKNTLLRGDFAWNEYPLKEQAESLYWLSVNNCSLSGSLTYDAVATVNTKGLNELQRLQGLDLSSNHLTHILHSPFRGPQRNLSTLILSRNKILHIENNAFQHIPLLKHIDLSHNQLTIMQRNFFSNPPHYLEHIDFSWNFLDKLPQDMFNNMPALRIVNLSHNFLHSLPTKPWSQVWKQLSFVDISGNFVECDCDLLWLLPILVTTNSTFPSALPGQTVIGRCAQPLKQEDLQALNHNFTSLTRGRLNC